MEKAYDMNYTIHWLGVWRPDQSRWNNSLIRHRGSRRRDSRLRRQADGQTYKEQQTGALVNMDVPTWMLDEEGSPRLLHVLWADPYKFACASIRPSRECLTFDLLLASPTITHWHTHPNSFPCVLDSCQQETWSKKKTHLSPSFKGHWMCAWRGERGSFSSP